MITYSKEQTLLKDSVFIKQFENNITIKDTIPKEKLNVVYGRIKLICDKMGKPYDEGETDLIWKHRDRLENKYAKYRIEFYKGSKKVKEVFTDKTKNFKYEVNLPDSTYYFIKLFLKAKGDDEFLPINIERNDDVNTNKDTTKRHIWLNCGGC
jgi:hypothetical protein